MRNIYRGRFLFNPFRVGNLHIHETPDCIRGHSCSILSGSDSRSSTRMKKNNISEDFYSTLSGL